LVSTRLISRSTKRRSPLAGISEEGVQRREHLLLDGMRALPSTPGWSGTSRRSPENIPAAPARGGPRGRERGFARVPLSRTVPPTSQQRPFRPSPKADLQPDEVRQLSPLPQVPAVQAVSLGRGGEAAVGRWTPAAAPQRDHAHQAEEVAEQRRRQETEVAAALAQEEQVQVEGSRRVRVQAEQSRYYYQQRER
jgi:hypothetical protein